MSISLQTVGAQANDSPPTQSNSELTMSLVGGTTSSMTLLRNHHQMIHKLPQQPAIHHFYFIGSSSSLTNRSALVYQCNRIWTSKIRRRWSRQQDNSESSKDQKTPEGSVTDFQHKSLQSNRHSRLPRSRAISKFVANQLGLSERPAMTIQEIQNAVSGMALMNNSRQ